MRKFKQSVSMRCTHTKYEKDLKGPLIELGYSVGREPGNSEYLVTDMDKFFYGISRYGNEKAFHIEHYNPELFMAIAAMSEGGNYPGEWVISCTGFEKILLRSPTIVSKLVGVRKATLDELIEHFTTDSEKKTIKNMEEMKTMLVITPRNIHEGKRIKEIMSAIDRFISADRPIPESYLEELYDLLYRRLEDSAA